MGSIASEAQPGKRLLHVTIDDIARSDPDRPYASLPYDDDDLAKGYEDITFAVLANAIDKLAWHIESCLGPETDVQTYAYIGTPDLRYQIMSMATAKLSKRVLFSSHMHSTEAHLNLINKTDTQVMFTATGVDVSDILANRPIPHFHIPSLEDLLSPTIAKQYPYSKTFSEAALDDYLILHSSGSTGLPKPITINHAAIACMDNIASLPPTDPHTKQQRRFLQNPGPGTRFFLPFLPL
jgi:acyl-coenzyme A synthetase/AMP-(fatty) acid ligase